MGALADLLAGPVDEVAPRLLGAIVRHGPVAVRLTEVEAYDGAHDPASHAYRGRTRRNAVMFGHPGHLYCYLSHGIHVCGNVSVGPEGRAAGVLMRAGEVIDGIELVRALRPGVPDRHLARGPGRLGRTLGLVLDHNGTDLTSGTVTLTPGEQPAAISRGPRTGVRNGADREWRFWATGDPTVSPYRRHAQANGL